MADTVLRQPVGKPFWYRYTFTDVDGSDIDDTPNAITISSRGFVWDTLTWDAGSNVDMNLRIWDEGRGESFSTSRINLAGLDDNLPLPLPVWYPFKPNSAIRLEIENDGSTDNAVVTVILGGFEPSAPLLRKLLAEYDAG